MHFAGDLTYFGRSFFMFWQEFGVFWHPVLNSWSIGQKSVVLSREGEVCVCVCV
jgi:hypothetical protein